MARSAQHWIDRFLHHLQTERRLSANTCKHYQRDLDELHNWCKTAGINDWGAICWANGQIYEATMRENLEIFDRVGGGDSFASGLIYGLMTTRDPQQAVEYGAAHGALAMTTPGDTTMARLAEVEKIMAGGGARVDR